MRINKHWLLLFLHDFLVIMIAAFFSKVIIEKIVVQHYSTILFYCIEGVSFSIFFVFLFQNNFYKYQFVLNPAKHTVGLIKSLFISLVLLILFAFIFKIQIIITNRIYVGQIYAIFFILFFISRIFIVPKVYYWLVKNKYVSRNLIIIGTGSLSVEKVKFLNQSKNSYYNIIGYLDSNESVQGTTIEGYKVLGHIKDLIRISSEYNVKDVLISLEDMSNWKLQNVINFCKRSNNTIHVVSELYNIITEKMEIDEIGGISSFRVKRSNFLIYQFIKRVYDIFISLFVIIGFFPLWILIILLIKISSRGPVFYMAKVVGLRQKEFLMYKFRSMYYQSSTATHEKLVTEMILNNKPTEKLKKDNRVTSIGKILRKLSIDEFPQFINVLKGEMSIIGPRPCLPYEFELMDKWHRGRFAIKPGITGLWQIKGRNEVRFNDQIALDLYYIEHRSIRLDVEIMLKTIPVLLFGKGGV